MLFTQPLFSRSFPRSQSYLQAASDGPAGHGLDPSANYNSPKFRSRNQSYMRAVSLLSQASCVSQVGTPPPLGPWAPSLKLCGSQASSCQGDSPPPPAPRPGLGEARRRWAVARHRLPAWGLPEVQLSRHL